MLLPTVDIKILKDKSPISNWKYVLHMGHNFIFFSVKDIRVKTYNQNIGENKLF